MGNDHEYALIGGINRASVGRVLGTIAASVSALLVFLLLSIVNIAAKFGVDANIPPAILSLIGAAAVYAALYLLFNKALWRWTPIANFMKVPNLSGEWDCEGRTSFDDNGEHWAGKVTISQTWDKICVVLQTGKSRSESVSAALVSEGIGSYRLLYHYVNTPRKFEDGLEYHHGFADIIFDKSRQVAEGPYFTGRGRTTYGTMEWKRS